MEDPIYLHLSKGILEMKFMKKSKDRVQREQEAAEGQAMYSNEITEEMKKSGNIVFSEAGISQCKNLIEGRLSFGGMNPEIEKLMQNDYAKKKGEAEAKLETEVSDVQMAEYSSLTNAISNKFNSKKNKNKRKFLKPKEDI